MNINEYNSKNMGKQVLVLREDDIKRPVEKIDGIASVC